MFLKKFQIASHTHTGRHTVGMVSRPAELVQNPEVNPQQLRRQSTEITNNSFFRPFTHSTQIKALTLCDGRGSNLSQFAYMSSVETVIPYSHTHTILCYHVVAN